MPYNTHIHNEPEIEKMKHFQPINTNGRFSKAGTALPTAYFVAGKLHVVTMQSGGTGRPHDPYYRKPLIVGAVQGTNPVDAVNMEKGELFKVHYPGVDEKHLSITLTA